MPVRSYSFLLIRARNADQMNDYAVKNRHRNGRQREGQKKRSKKNKNCAADRFKGVMLNCRRRMHETRLLDVALEKACSHRNDDRRQPERKPNDEKALNSNV